MTTRANETCGLCGRPAEGYALADSVRLCHSDERDCYHRWTVYGERPSIPTTSRLAEIRKRLAEAPAGPWRMGENEDAQVFIQAIRLLGEMAGAELLICEVETDWPKPAREIGDLIANAPADLAWACDRIELLEGLLREAREYLKWRFCGDDGSGRADR